MQPAPGIRVAVPVGNGQVVQGIIQQQPPAVPAPPLPPAIPVLFIPPAGVIPRRVIRAVPQPLMLVNLPLPPAPPAHPPAPVRRQVVLLGNPRIAPPPHHAAAPYRAPGAPR